MAVAPVENADLVAARREPLHNRPANEQGPPDDENSHPGI